MLLDPKGRFLGSGFFVAQRVAVTCAHVVEKVADQLSVVWQGRTMPARVLVRDPPSNTGTGEYPYPDVAFIGVDNLDNPVGFIEGAPIGTGIGELEIHGFSRYTPHSDPVPDTVVVRVIGDAGAYKKVDGRHLVPGMSGAPAVDRSGAIRGMLKSGPLRYGESGSIIPGRVLKFMAIEHGGVLGVHIRARPPLSRPRRGSALHGMLTAQREVAKRYPYRLAQLTRRTAPPLSTVYVEQRTEAWAETSSPGVLAAAPEPVVISPTEMLRRHRNVLVVGGPGGGKSTLLQQLVASCAEWWLQPAPIADEPDDEPQLGRVVAVRTGATDLLSDGAWFELVARSVNRDLRGFQNRDVPPDLFQSPPVHGAEWLIMVDGLDEVIDSHQRNELVHMLRHRVAEYGTETRFLVTSRRLAEHEFSGLRASLDTADRVERLGEYDLRPFDEDAVKQFAVKWFRPPDGEHSPVEPGEFLAAIHAGGLAPMIQVPLLATIAAVVYEERPRTPLPMDRAGLYEVFVTVLLTQRNQRLGSRQLFLEQFAEQSDDAQEYGRFLFNNRLECLSHIALRARGGDRRPLTELAAEWLHRQDRKPPLGVTALHLRELLLSTGLLVTQGGDLAFVHQSFAEYLAARLISADFDPPTWVNSVRARGPDSLGMFMLAGWVRAGNDPLPVVRSLLDAGDRREYPNLPEVAAVMEDGGALVKGAGPQVVALAAQAIRRMGGLADRAAPVVNRVLRAIIQRAGSSSIVLDLATDARLPTMKRVEAARVLITSGSPEDRRAGLQTAVRLAYETPMSDEDRLWAQRSLAEVGGPLERPHAVQRMVQAVETSASEAVRVRALILLAQLNEFPAAAAALIRRSLDTRLPLVDRIGALDALHILADSVDYTEPWMRPGDHAARLDFTSRTWRRPVLDHGSADEAFLYDLYTDALRAGLAHMASFDLQETDRLVEAAMRDGTLGWARRVFIARTLYATVGRTLARRAVEVLVEDKDEAPANRVLSARLFADPVELPRIRERIRGWLDDPLEPAAMRRAALAYLADALGPGFVTAVAADPAYPGYLRVAAALRRGRDRDGADEARRLLRALGREAGWSLRRRLPVVVARVALALSLAISPRVRSGRVPTSSI